MLLIADIGGTKTHLRLHDGATVAKEAIIPSAEHASLTALLRTFLPAAAPTVAVMGVAGPVADGRCVTTNLPWHLDERQLEADLGIAKVKLFNDFAIAALGVPHVPADMLAELKKGTKRPGPIGVLGAGTGLGEALLVPAGDHFEVLPSEGAHADFGPRDAVDDALTGFLRQKYGRVSWERVVSGTGLRDVHDFTRMRRELPMDHVDAKEISAREAAGDEAAREAFDIFVRGYGAEAGNLALRGLTRGGVYLCGGIAPKMVKRLQDGAFAKSFGDKGRLAHAVADIPVWVVTAPDVALRGALAEALRLQ